MTDRMSSGYVETLGSVRTFEAQEACKVPQPAASSGGTSYYGYRTVVRTRLTKRVWFHIVTRSVTTIAPMLGCAVLLADEVPFVVIIAGATLCFPVEEYFGGSFRNIFFDWIFLGKITSWPRQLSYRARRIWASSPRRVAGMFCQTIIWTVAPVAITFLLRRQGMLPLHAFAAGMLAYFSLSLVLAYHFRKVYDSVLRLTAAFVAASLGLAGTWLLGQHIPNVEVWILWCVGGLASAYMAGTAWQATSNWIERDDELTIESMAALSAAIKAEEADERRGR